MKKGIVLMSIGAGLMYLFDPEQGEARRSQLRDKFAGVLPQTKEALEAKTEAITTQASTLAEKADSIAAEKISAIGPEADGGDSDGGGSDAEKSDSETENASAPAGNPT
jgi:ATP-dependent Zn protease